jgi:hypothetical protein
VIADLIAKFIIVLGHLSFRSVFYCHRHRGQSTHDCTHLQPNISAFKCGVDDTACRANAG